jgi:hypothetical protein
MAKVFYLAIDADEHIAIRLRKVADLVEQKEMAGDSLRACGYYSNMGFDYHITLIDHGYGGRSQPLLNTYERE